MKSPESIAASMPEGHGQHCQTCGAWRGAFGLEPTIELYIEHTVTILRELRRVLRSDGVLFWNIGDSYASAWACNRRDIVGQGAPPLRDRQNKLSGLKEKDLCLIPARVAIAAQADGWWVRSMIVWAKPNPMPESVTDRPTDAYEYIIMLTKRERYFWDADAVRESAEYGRSEEIGAKIWMRSGVPSEPGRTPGSRTIPGNGGTRNLRNVWNFATQPYSGAHFATFPEELPRRCILAATSARGACLQCGAPWERVATRPTPPKDLFTKGGGPDDGLVMGYGSTGSRHGSGQKLWDWLTENPSKTIGWRPTCLCRGQRGKVAPCVVLDPFGGSGTTGRVALELRRRAVLCDVAYGPDDEYRRLAEQRTRNVQVEFF